MDNWRGVLIEKNIAGAISAITIILFIFDAGHIRLAVRALVLSVAFVFLYFTKSKTSLGLLGPVTVAGWLLLPYRIDYKLLVSIGIVMSCLGIVLVGYIYLTDLMPYLQADDTLTGRVLIWPALVSYWQENWILGAGFGSFWDIGSDSPIYRYTASWVTQVGNGHNGYLDLMAQLGTPGIFLAVSSLLIIPFSKLLSLRGIDPCARSLYVAMLIFCAAHNLNESSMLDRDSPMNIILFVTVALVWRQSALRLGRADQEASRIT
ncbi:O-antigen ligase family protein [Alsobacter sp. KACC 23698]|uniref:O-antigen ligase family protein n=1 Tax=Alsobacter sp. KACC 23698 TaxID=3149229 RepID=A0AAU7JN61_9HYPH